MMTLLAPVAPPRPFRWSAQTYHDLCDSGVFGRRNVILIRGEILEMPQPNPLHDGGLTLATRALERLIPAGMYLRSQMGLDLGNDTDPGPDIAIVRGDFRDYLDRFPTSAELIVEIANSSLDYDLTTKAELYATANIAEYWVVDLNARELHVFRDPAPIPDSGQAYRTRRVLSTADNVTPLAFPAASIRVSELLP